MQPAQEAYRSLTHRITSDAAQHDIVCEAQPPLNPNPPKTKVPEMLVALQRLKGATERLHGAINELSQRLTPVSRSEPTADKPLKSPACPGTPLASVIEESVRSIQDAENRLGYMIAMLEI
jgi:hypothetical protein